MGQPNNGEIIAARVRGTVIDDPANGQIHIPAICPVCGTSDAWEGIVENDGSAATGGYIYCTGCIVRPLTREFSDLYEQWNKLPGSWRPANEYPQQAGWYLFRPLPVVPQSNLHTVYPYSAVYCHWDGGEWGYPGLQEWLSSGIIEKGQLNEEKECS